MNNPITIKTSVHAPLQQVWECWTSPEHIVKWNAASEDWHCPRATNDLREGGCFTSRMEAKDGSMGFDFGGVYTKVIPMETIAYTMGDDRKVKVHFEEREGKTNVVEIFEPEEENSRERQQEGWQSILDKFKEYTQGLL